MKLKLSLLIIKKSLIFSVLLSAYSIDFLHAQSFNFAELQGQPVMNTAGWNLTGNALVGDTPGDADNFNNELILTNPSGNQSGGVFFNQPINLGICTEWVVTFDFRMFDGNGADGIAFCFLDIPPAGFVPGGGVGIPGTANGLKIVFDSWDNGCGTNPEIQVGYGVGYNECPQANFNLVKVNNSGGNLGFLRSNGYNSAQITYNSGNISVTVNGTLWLTANYTANFTGYMGFTASTGGSTDRHSIRNVTIYTPIPPSDAGADVAFCSGGSAQLGSAGNPAFLYSWSPATGLSQSDVANPTVTLTNPGGTPQQITYTVTTALAANPSACSSSDQVVVTVNPAPLSSFTLSDTVVCENEPVTVTYTGNMPPLAGYTWNFGSADILSGTNPSQGPFVLSWPASGTFDVTLSVAQFGCFSPITTQSVTVNPYPQIFIAGHTEICSGDTAVLTANSDLNGTAFQWLPGNETTVQITVNPSTTTLFQLIGTSPAGCISDTATSLLTVKPTPVASISGPVQICAGDTVLLTGSSTVNGATFSWEPGGETASSLSVSPVSDAEYGLSLESDGCFSDTVFIEIAVDSVPDFSVPDSTQICPGDAVSITAISNTPGVNFDWNTGEFTGNPYLSTPAQTLEISVFAFGENCTSAVKTTVVEVLENCNCEVTVPNIFTPNGDGVNDEFSVQDPQKCAFTEYKLLIYNRWGNVVWKAEDVAQVWNGKSLFGNAPDGTYYYVLNFSYKPGANEPKQSVEKGILVISR
jgi:gliding motility-associated-like protein